MALIICAALLFACSCGNSREDEQPEYTNTSQINLYISPEGSGHFTTDENYSIIINRGQILISDIVISSDSEEHEHEDDHQHAHTMRHEEVDEAGECHFHGTFAINLLESLFDLGFENTNPGVYSNLSLTVSQDNQQETVNLEGTANKGGVEYPFHVSLNMDESIALEHIGLELATGYYKRVKIVLEVDHWLDGVDISGANIEDGIYCISDTMTPTLAGIIKENIRDHILIEVMDDD